MAKDEDPLDLSLEDLLMEEELEPGDLAPALAGKLSAFRLFDRHSTPGNKPAKIPADSDGAKPLQDQDPADAPLLKLRSGQQAPTLPAHIDREALSSRIEEELIEEFNRVIPKLMDQALDHMVERLPVIINRKLVTHMLEYLLENRERILYESTKKRGS